MITEQEQLRPGGKSYDIAFFLLPSLSHNCIVPYSLFSLVLLSSCALLLRIVLALKRDAALLAAPPRITALAHSRCTDFRFTAAIHGRGCGDSAMRRLAGRSRAECLSSRQTESAQKGKNHNSGANLVRELCGVPM